MTRHKSARKKFKDVSRIYKDPFLCWFAGHLKLVQGRILRILCCYWANKHDDDDDDDETCLHVQSSADEQTPVQYSLLSLFCLDLQFLLSVDLLEPCTSSPRSRWHKTIITLSTYCKFLFWVCTRRNDRINSPISEMILMIDWCYNFYISTLFFYPSVCLLSQIKVTLLCSWNCFFSLHYHYLFCSRRHKQMDNRQSATEK